MLYFKGITTVFHDIDIMVVEEDIPKLKELLLSMGTLAPTSPNQKYKTKYFLEFSIDAVDVDVMAGFMIVSGGTDYDCSFKPDQIAEYHQIGDASIPMQSVERWREYYRLMGRDEKVCAIDSVQQMRATNLHERPLHLRNLIFDMGNVLLRFDPEAFLLREGITDPEQKELLLRNIFRSTDWPRLDSGEWDEEDLETAVLPRLPKELHSVAKRLIYHWYEPIIPVDGMKELVARCKEEGYRLYLLSNSSRRQHLYWNAVPGHECFDGTVVSADVQSVKPGQAIFLFLMDTYNLKPEESLFIDDLEDNLRAARSIGISTFLFRGCAKELESFLFG